MAIYKLKYDYYYNDEHKRLRRFICQEDALSANMITWKKKDTDNIHLTPIQTHTIEFLLSMPDTFASAAVIADYVSEKKGQAKATSVRVNIDKLNETFADKVTHGLIEENVNTLLNDDEEALKIILNDDVVGYFIPFERIYNAIPSLPGENEYFTGREKELDMVETSFFTFDHPAVLLQGPGGIGKSSIALRYAYLHKDPGEDRDGYSMILWVDGGSISSIISSYKRFLLGHNIQVPEDDISVCNIFKDYLQKHPKWLIIYDNCDFYTRDDNRCFRDDCLPHGDGHVLITSRDMDTVPSYRDSQGNLIKALEIGLLEENEAIMFLKKRSDIYDDDEGAAELAKRLHRFPLALDLAGAYLETTKCGFAKYIQKIDSDIGILEDRSEAIDYGRIDQTLESIILFTLDHIRKNEPDPALEQCIRELLYTSSYSYPNEIDLNAYSTFPDNQDARLNHKIKAMTYGLRSKNLDESSLKKIELKVHEDFQNVVKSCGKLCQYCHSDADLVKGKALKYGLLKENGDFLKIHPLLAEIVRKRICPKGMDFSAVVQTVYSAYCNSFDAEGEYKPFSNTNWYIDISNRHYMYSEMVFIDDNIDVTDFQNIHNALHHSFNELCSDPPLCDENKCLRRLDELVKNHPLKDLSLEELVSLQRTLCNGMYVFKYWAHSSLENKRSLQDCMFDVYSTCVWKFFHGENSIDDLDHYLESIILVITALRYRIHYDSVEMEFITPGLQAISTYIAANGVDEYVQEHNGLFSKFFGFSKVLMHSVLAYLTNQSFSFDLQLVALFNELLIACTDAIKDTNNEALINEFLDLYYKVINYRNLNDTSRNSLDHEQIDKLEFWRITRVYDPY